MTRHLLSPTLLTEALVVLIATWLLAGILRLALRGKTVPRLDGMICAAALLVLMPWKGVSAAGWVAGATAGFSIPLLALVAHATGRMLGYRGFLRTSDLRDIGRGGLVLGVLLYPSVLGWVEWDSYQFGWMAYPDLLCLIWTLHLLIRGSQLGWILVLTLAFWLFQTLTGNRLGLMESTNLWDYLVDPVLVLVSIPLAFLKTDPEPEPRHLEAQPQNPPEQAPPAA
ncbi:MAG: hypothetical protein RLZ45_809 [Verrucomicrobiota bacterium]|jgi:hypothetical protein